MLQLFTTLQAIFADRKNDEGATAVEYGLIVALIAAVIIATVTLVGADVLGAFETIEDGLGDSQN